MDGCQTLEPPAQVGHTLQNHLGCDDAHCCQSIWVRPCWPQVQTKVPPLSGVDFIFPLGKNSLWKVSDILGPTL